MNLTIDQTKVYFNSFGQGKNLLLLHGWGCDRKIWTPFLPYLSSDLKVIVLDLPGFGRSSFPEKPWTLSDYAHFLKRFLKELDLTRVTLLGHSFGGRIAIKFASSHPKLLHKLILVATAGIKPKKSILGWTCLLAAKTGKILFKIPPFSFFSQNFRSLFYKTIKRTDYLEAEKLRETFLKVIDEDLTPLLGKIRSPTLIIWGEKDQEVPLKFAKMLTQKIPHSRLCILKSCGHFPFLEKPKELAKAINSFV